MLFQEKFSHPQGVMVVVIGKGVDADVNLVREHLAIGNLGVRVLQIGSAGSERFDFSSEQHNPGLIGIFDMKIVSRFSVFSNFFDTILVHY